MISSTRLRQIFTVGGVETFAVILSGISGLLIVNFLPKDQYAIYTFLSACMLLMLGITDTGLAHACLPVVGRRSSEAPWVLAACAQVFRKRWVLLFAGFLVVGPYWYFTSRQHDWDGLAYWTASLLIVAILFLTLREHYAGTVLTILGEISLLNRIGFTASSIRILFIAAVLLLPSGAYALAGVLAATATASAVCVGFYVYAFRKRRLQAQPLDPAQAKEVDAHIFRFARPLVLPAVFYQFQGVITVFIVSLFGDATMLAEVGAFGRLAMLLLVFDRVAGVLLFPAIARAPDGGGLQTLIAKGHLAYLGIMALAFSTALLVPHWWMLLLGNQYQGRESLVWMVFLSALLMASAGFAFRTVAARGHTGGQTWIIPFVLAVQMGYLGLFGATTLETVLGFGIATSLANFLYQYAMLARWFVLQRRRPAA